MKNKIKIIAMLSLFTHVLYCQQNKIMNIDSLKIELKKNDVDSVMFNILFEITEIYMRSNIDSAIHYRKKMEALLGNDESDQKIRLEIFKIKEFIYSNNFKKAIEHIAFFKSRYYEKCKIIYKLKFNYLEAVYYEFNGDFKKSSSIVEATLQEFGYYKNVLIADFHLNRTNQLIRTSNFLLAIKHANSAVDIYRENNDIEGLNNAFIILSNLYINFKDFDSAFKYINKAIDLDNIHKGKFQIIQEKSVLGLILYNQKKYKESKEVFDYILNESVHLINFKQAFEVAFYYRNLCNYFLKDYNKVINDCKTALKSINSEYGQLTTNYLLVISYNKLGQFNDAKKHLDETTFLKSRLKHLSAQFEFDFLNAKMDTENGLGNFKDAFDLSKEYLEKFTKYNDSVNFAMVASSLSSFEMKEKELQLKDLRLKSTENQLILEKLNKERLILSLTIIFVTISLIVLFAFFKALSKKNILLTKINQVIENSKSRIEILLKELHHRTKNNLELIISMLQIQARRKNYIDINEFISINETRISSMAMIHQYLYLNDVSSNQISLQDYFTDLVKAIKSTFSGNKDINFVLNSHEIYCKLNTAIALGIIINELTTNSLKYAFPETNDGQIKIIFEKIADARYKLIYSDNGIGFDLKNKTGNSFGIDLINLLVGQLHGSVQYENSNGAHYTIEFSEIESNE